MGTRNGRAGKPALTRASPATRPVDGFAIHRFFIQHMAKLAMNRTLPGALPPDPQDFFRHGSDVQPER